MADKNTSIFSLYFNEKELKKIQNIKIMIIGCGGLGSNIATILVRTGFSKLILIDYDKVELKNLNRQNYLIKDIGMLKVDAIKKNLLQINPNISLLAINKKINKKNLKNIIRKYSPGIIVEAVDNNNTKAMIFETSLEMDKIVVTASGIAGYGNIDDVKIIRQKKYSIIGDFKTEICLSNRKNHKSKKMPLAPKVTMIAAMQADEVLRRVLEEDL